MPKFDREKSFGREGCVEEVLPHTPRPPTSPSQRKILMLDVYLEIFYSICIQFVSIVPAVLGVYLLVKFISDLLFKD